MNFKSDGILNNPMRKTFNIKDNEFVIQSCYYRDDILCFNIGVKHNDIFIYESGSYYSFDDSFSFDNRERIKKDRDFIQIQIIFNMSYILEKIKELI